MAKSRNPSQLGTGGAAKAARAMRGSTAKVDRAEKRAVGASHPPSRSRTQTKHPTVKKKKNAKIYRNGSSFSQYGK